MCDAFLTLAQTEPAMSMRVARALDHAGRDESEKLLLHLATPFVFCQSHLDSPGHWQYGSLPLAAIACGSSNGRCPRPTLEGCLAGPPVRVAQEPNSGD